MIKPKTKCVNNEIISPEICGISRGSISVNKLGRERVLEARIRICIWVGFSQLAYFIIWWLSLSCPAGGWCSCILGLEGWKSTNASNVQHEFLLMIHSLPLITILKSYTLLKSLETIDPHVHSWDNYRSIASSKY